LEYLAPRTGRRAPAYSRANDLWHWQTTLRTGDAAKAAHKLRRAKNRIISPTVVEITGKTLGFDKGFLARDLTATLFR
jgi:hypothetical protein